MKSANKEDVKLKLFLKIALFLTLVLVVLFFAFKVPDTDGQAMIAKYGQDAIKVDDGLGGHIYYRDQGNRNGEVLLLIHGSNSSMQAWNGMINVLADSYRIISFDLYGHGITGKHPDDDYSANAQISAAIKVLDAAGVDQAVWVGNSMGGWLTWRAALSHPERVSRLVLIDASGAQGGEKAEVYLAAKILSSSVVQKLSEYIMPRSMVEASIQDNYVDHSKISDQLIDQYWELLRFPGNRAAIAHRFKTSREPEVWEQISNIKQPTLLLWGEQDVVTPFSNTKLFQQKLPQSKLVSYPNASHLPMEELPIEVAQDIDQWLIEQ